MCEENFSLCKKLPKLLEDGLSWMRISYISLKQVEYFYPTKPISRERVCMNQIIKDEQMACLEDLFCFVFIDMLESEMCVALTFMSCNVYMVCIYTLVIYLFEN